MGSGRGRDWQGQGDCEGIDRVQEGGAGVEARARERGKGYVRRGRECMHLRGRGEGGKGERSLQVSIIIAL